MLLSKLKDEHDERSGIQTDDHGVPFKKKELTGISAVVKIFLKSFKALKTKFTAHEVHTFFMDHHLFNKHCLESSKHQTGDQEEKVLITIKNMLNDLSRNNVILKHSVGNKGKKTGTVIHFYKFINKIMSKKKFF